MVSSCQESTTRPAFPTKHNKLPPHTTSHAGISNAVQQSFSRRPEVQRRSYSNNVPTQTSCCMKGNYCTCTSPAADEEAGAAADEKAEVEKKILALQRIVPGGESLGVDKLFEETAGYILALQFQVKALRALTNFVEGSEKENRKLGG